MYSDVNFSIESMEQIEDDLREARSLYKNVKRVFLLNGDAFVLSYDRLKAIAQKTIDYFPELETITMYASIRNIMDKTDEELKDLRENYRINELYIGLETGDPETLRKIKKGHSIDDALIQLRKLEKANIEYTSLFMLGLGGDGRGHISAKATSQLINQTNPRAIWFGTLAIYPSSDLALELEKGLFTPATELEVLNEEKELIRSINNKDLAFYGIHPTNLASVQGVLPRDREAMIYEIDSLIDYIGEDNLNKSLKRTSL